MFSQIPTPRSVSTETLTAIGAVLGSLALLGKKILARRQTAKAEYITRLEFHQSQDAMRDRIGAGYLALAEKIDATQKELLAALNRQATAIEHRLDKLETNLARLDERTARRPH